jgi:hypothetical protein
VLLTSPADQRPKSTATPFRPLNTTSTRSPRAAWITIPGAVSVFPGETDRAPWSSTEKSYRNLIYFPPHRQQQVTALLVIGPYNESSLAPARGLVPTRLSVRVAPADKDMVGNGVPSVVNTNEQQQQRGSANDKEHLARLRMRCGCRQRQCGVRHQRQKAMK